MNVHMAPVPHIASRTSIPPMGVPAEVPLPPAPVQGGGGDQLRLNEYAQLEVTKSILGLIPVTVRVDMGEILEGKYGRDFQMTSVNSDWVHVSGRAQVGPFTQDVNEIMPVQTGGCLQNMAAHIGEDGLVYLQGKLKLLGIPLPFTCALQPQRQSQETFQFKFTDLRIGEREPLRLPSMVGAWLTSAALTLFGKIEGIKAMNMDTLSVDFAAVARAAQPQGPAPTLPV